MKTEATYLETGESAPKLFMSTKEISKYEGKSETFVRKVFREIETFLGERYPACLMGQDKPRTVSYYVYRDYISHRDQLQNRNTRKYVEPYNPMEIAKSCPMLIKVITIDKEDKY